MRSTLVPLALIAVVGSASLAMASTTATGIIKSLDMKDHSITLADGATYVLPKGFDEKTLKVGEKVSVVWDMNGKAMDATKVTIVK
jgi:Cu/Ag efflux protein CusF